MTEPIAWSTLVDATNQSATTRYYPTQTDDRGVSVDGKTVIAVQMTCSGGVTVTIEASLDETDNAATEDWVDVTKSFESQLNKATGAASFVDKSDIILLNGALLRRVRIKSVTSDTSNAVRYVLGVL